VNIAGTLNLLDLSREFNVPKFIFGSSSSVYELPSAFRSAESNTELRPISPYARRNFPGNVVFTYAHLYGLTAVCLRFFTVYGPRQRPDLAIHNLLDCLKPSARCRSSGMACRKRLHIRGGYRCGGSGIDRVRARFGAGKQPIRDFQSGDSHPVRLGELVELLEKHRTQSRPSANFLNSRATSHHLGGYLQGQAAAWLRSSDTDRKGLEQFVSWYRRARINHLKGGLKPFDLPLNPNDEFCPRKELDQRAANRVIRILFNVCADADNYNAQSLNAKGDCAPARCAHFESTLFFERSPDTRLLRAGIRTVKLPGRRKTIRILREMMGRYDFIVYIDLSPASYIYLHLPRLLRRGTKSVLCMEGPRGNLDGVSAAVRKYADYAIRHADLRTAVSAFVAQDASDLYGIKPAMIMPVGVGYASLLSAGRPKSSGRDNLVRWPFD